MPMIISLSCKFVTVDCNEFSICRILSKKRRREKQTMNSLSATGFLPNYSLFNCTKHRRFCSRMPPVFSSLKSSVEVNELSGDDVLQAFFRERKLDGDIVARISDELWLRGANVKSRNFEEVSDNNNNTNFIAQQALEEENEGGFLKLKTTTEWLLGDIDSAPMNKKMTLKEVADESEKRRRLNFLRYEALKRELLLLTVAIGTACSGYCLVTLSIQAAVSYATGVLFSCLYFQLLCKQADSISREMVPDIFRQRKAKKIGIRSEDLQDSLEKTLKGISFALSSPRLVIPAAIYGIWELSQHFTHDIFDFQLVPAMVGLFAYKAAALVQVYRDNEDLHIIFPDSSV